LGELALGLEADFVEDTAEDHDAADGVARGANGKGHEGWVNREDRFVKGIATRVARRKSWAGERLPSLTRLGSLCFAAL
jgi:hypothetical protein